MSEARTILRHSPIYLAAALLNRGTGVILVMAYSRWLGIEAYGMLGVAMIAAELIGIVTSLQIADGLARFVFEHKDEQRRLQVVATAVFGLAGLTLIATPIFALVLPWVAQWAVGDRQLAPLFLVAGLATCCDTGFAILLTYLRSTLRSSAVLIASTARSVLLLGSGALLVGYFDFGLSGAVWGLCLANALAVVVLAVVMLGRTGIRFDRDDLGAMLRYGAKITPAYLIEAGAKFVERAWVAQLVGLASAGAFYLALRLCDLLSQLLIVPFQQVFVVGRYDLHRDGGSDPQGPRLHTAFAALLATAALGLAALGPELVSVLAGRGYDEAARVLPPLAAATVVFALSGMIELPIHFAKRPDRITYAVAVAACLHLPLVWLGAWSFGALGAACGRLGGVAIRIACTTVAARGLPGPRPQWTRLLVLAGVTAIAFLALAAAGRVPGGLGLGLRLAVVAVFPAAVLLAPVFAPRDRAWVLARFGGPRAEGA